MNLLQKDERDFFYIPQLFDRIRSCLNLSKIFC